MTDLRVVQRVIDPSLLISGHRVSLRVYLVLTWSDGALTAWTHDHGKLVYTAEPAASDADLGRRYITTTADGWEGPPDAPRERADLGAVLTTVGLSSDDLEQSLGERLIAAVEAASEELFPSGHLAEHDAFQLFGADFVLSNDGTPWLLEINKMPDMRPKSPRDEEGKRAVFGDLLAVGGVLDGPPSKSMRRLETLRP